LLFVVVEEKERVVDGDVTGWGNGAKLGWILPSQWNSPPRFLHCATAKEKQERETNSAILSQISLLRRERERERGTIKSRESQQVNTDDDGWWNSGRDRWHGITLHLVLSFPLKTFSTVIFN